LNKIELKPILGDICFVLKNPTNTCSQIITNKMAKTIDKQTIILDL